MVSNKLHGNGRSLSRSVVRRFVRIRAQHHTRSTNYDSVSRVITSSRDAVHKVDGICHRFSKTNFDKLAAKTKHILPKYENFLKYH